MLAGGWGTGGLQEPPLGSYLGQGTVACSCQHRALLGSFPENSSQGKVRASFHKSDAGSQLLVVPRTRDSTRWGRSALCWPHGSMQAWPPDPPGPRFWELWVSRALAA